MSSLRGNAADQMMRGKSRRPAGEINATAGEKLLGPLARPKSLVLRSLRMELRQVLGIDEPFAHCALVGLQEPANPLHPSAQALQSRGWRWVATKTL